MSSSPSSATRQHLWRHLFWLTLLGLGLFFFRLGEPGLMDPDEGRYAEIAREMLVLKDWLAPHLNLLPYLEKPPLVYWLTALSFSAFGYQEWAARLPAALSALGGVWWAYLFGRSLWGPGAAFWGALILAGSGGYVVLGRILILDMPLTFFLSLGLGLGYLALSRERGHLWPWAYLALGLAVLTKGPVALVLAGLIWGLWCLAAKRAAILKPLNLPGLALLAGLCLPWFCYIAWRFPEFFRFFVWDQHLGRFLTASIHHGEPFWYYVPILLLLFLPWSFLLPWLGWRWRAGAGPDRLFLAIWAGVVLAFFSLSRGKLIPYILPALFPLALLSGEALHGLEEEDQAGRPGKIWRFSLAVWMILGWGLVALYFRPPVWLQGELVKAAILSPYLVLGLVWLAVIPTAALILRRREMLLAGAVLLSLLLPLGIERVSTERSPKELALTLKSHWQPTATLIGVQLYSQGVSFYSGKIFHLLPIPTELDFGRSLDPQNGLFFADFYDMAAFAAPRPLIFFYVKEKGYPTLRAGLPGPYQLLARFKDCLLLAFEGK